MQKVLGVRFKNAGKIYFFEPWPEELKTGEKVVVETTAGIEIAEVASNELHVKECEITSELKPILRKATEHDLQKAKQCRERAEKNISIVKSKVKDLGLEMNIVSLEYSLDGNKVVVNFTSENRVDFRDLLKELGSALKARIELRQIGARDETKILGGLGPCGKPCCCKRFLEDFEHVSVKMAKTQNLSLNPTKISGLCGRLMCCLAYENDFYSEALKRMPKLGSTIKTSEGEGIVVSTDLIKQSIGVKFSKDDSNLIKQISLDELENILHRNNESCKNSNCIQKCCENSEKIQNEKMNEEKQNIPEIKKQPNKQKQIRHFSRQNGGRNGLQNK